jgi:hypothetical protein
MVKEGYFPKATMGDETLKFMHIPQLVIPQ